MFLVNFFSSEGMDLFPDQYLFKWQHFVYLGVCAFLFWGLMKISARQSKTTQKLIISVACVLLLVFKYGGEAIFVWEWNHYGDSISSFSHPFWDWRTLISFQVCGVNNVLLPLVVWFDWKRFKDFVYPASIVGGLAVMLYPVGVLFGDPIAITFPLLRTLFVHFLLVFLPCYLIKIENFRLEPKYWYRALIGSLLVMAWAMFGNLFVDQTANNMYLMENPFAGGPVWILNAIPNGWHVLLLVFLCGVGIWLVYFVSGRYERHRQKKANVV